LERSKALPPDQISALRTAIGKAENSNSDRAGLKSFASSIKKAAASKKNSLEASRMRELSAIIEAD
jgi:hypothetical protein